jgi:hypothetical protein
MTGYEYAGEAALSVYAGEDLPAKVSYSILPGWKWSDGKYIEDIVVFLYRPYILNRQFSDRVLAKEE